MSPARLAPLPRLQLSVLFVPAWESPRCCPSTHCLGIPEKTVYLSFLLLSQAPHTLSYGPFQILETRQSLCYRAISRAPFLTCIILPLLHPLVTLYFPLCPCPLIPFLILMPLKDRFINSSLLPMLLGCLIHSHLSFSWDHNYLPRSHSYL